MGLDDYGYVEKLYGFYVTDWSINWGTFSNHHYMLDREYINDGCETVDSSDASDTNIFIYPFYTKKVYFVEGVIKGHISLAASEATSEVTAYRVTICRATLTEVEEIISTGWVTVNKTLEWHTDPTAYGDEIVFPFWIDCWQEQKFSDEEKLCVKIEINANQPVLLMHSNDPEWKDMCIEIPMRG